MSAIRIYLDNHATTQVDPRVVDAMLPYFTERFGNASSRNHSFGWDAERGVDEARRHVARLIGARAKDLVFTSGATESNNLAILGVARAARGGRRRGIVTVCTEHHAVLEPCEQLAREGLEVVVLPVRPDGLVDLERVRDAISDATLLVTVMAVNNEIGVIQPLAAIATMAHERGALFHTDASQALGRMPFDVTAVDADLASVTAHKMYGPKGVGGLYVRRRPFAPAIERLSHGGGHERGLRPGTLNVPAIVGFGAAAALCVAGSGTEIRRVSDLRTRLLRGLGAGVGDFHVNGSETARVPHNVNVSFPGVEGTALHLALDDVAVSSGAACTTDSAEPSHVLTALGIDADLARATVRVGLGRFTTAAEVDHFVGRMSQIVSELRARQATLGRA
ncbi:MAG: aminotransferase class V-fold PLP-dependent enzyme [Vicinamibacterales bacterium]